jgi:hypothetical protein
MSAAAASSSLYITLNVLGKDNRYVIYELDTIESIKNRIAANQPKIMPYLAGSLIPPLVILQETEEVSTTAKVVAGCKAIGIKHRDRSDINPLAMRKFKLIDFYSTTSTKLKAAGSDASKIKKYSDEIMKLFSIEDPIVFIKYVIFFIFGSLEKFQTVIDPVLRFAFIEAVEKNMGMKNFDVIRSQYDADKGDIQKAIQTNIAGVKKDLGLFTAFDRELSYEPTRTSSIQLDKTRISVKFQITTDVYELFNGLLLSPDIPFVAVGNFYKILTTFKPPKEWAIKFEQEDLLVMYVLNRKTESEKNKLKADPKNYSPVFIIPTSVDPVTHITNIEMEIESRVDDELREENLLDRIFQAFPFPVNNCSYEQKRVEADYLFLAPGTLDIPLFYDMIMNDPLVSQLLLIDESVRTFRERGGMFIYFRYNSHVSPKNFMSCRINIGLIEAKEQARDPELFPDLGEAFISVKMLNVPSTAEAERFRTIINKIFEYYYKPNYKEGIRRDYAYIFPNIDTLLASYEVRTTKAPIRRKMLKDLDPAVFVKDYQRFCTHEPTILTTEAEFEEAKAEGRDVMIFPLYGEGVRHAYVSNHPEYPFMGLKLNSLSNKHQFPYLPCCYPVSQLDNPKRPRYRYENQANDSPETQTGRVHRPNMFSSNKAMKRDNYGLLPTLVDKFLKTIDTRAFPVMGDQVPYARQGTLKDKNSVLDAIIKAVMDYYNDIDEPENRVEYRNFIQTRLPIMEEAFKSYSTLDGTERSAYLEQVRRDLVGLLPANTTVQSTFNMELRTVRDQLLSSTTYLDVKLFWRILEEVFCINIFLFQRNEDNPQGVLGSPMFLQEYLQYQRTKEALKWRFTIFLFETIGGEFDRLEYPQVELIKSFRYSEGANPTATIFSWFNNNKDKILLRRLQNCFNQIFGYDGHFNQPIPNAFVSKPLSQCADFYGKIRLLQFANGICILTEPLPPVDKNELQERSGRLAEPSCSLKPVDMNKARDFLRVEGVTDIRKVIVGDYVVGLQCSKDVGHDTTVDFYIPVNPTKEHPKAIPETAPVVAPSFIAQESLLEGFNRLARLARYIIEYVLWVFSKWHRENPGDVKDLDYITQFAMDKFQIVKDHEYPAKIPRRLDATLPGVVSAGGRIIVPSMDVRNRLVFALQIKLIQNIGEVLNYYSRTYIKNYYQDVTDFDLQTSNIILFGQEMVISWINSKLPHYVLHDRIVHPICPAPKDDENLREKEELCRLIEEKGLTIEPYFIKLENLDESIYIVQQARSLAGALYISQVWTERGWNVGPDDLGKVSTNTPFRFIAYNDAYDYTVEDINGNNPEYTILQYMMNDKMFTMALLKYSES